MSFGHKRLDVYRADIAYSGAVSTEEKARAKAVLDRIVAVLTKLGRRGYTVAEKPAGYAGAGIASDTDADSDPAGTEGQCARPDNSSSRQVQVRMPKPGQPARDEAARG